MVGSGKFAWPWERMHPANFSSRASNDVDEPDAVDELGEVVEVEPGSRRVARQNRPRGRGQNDNADEGECEAHARTRRLRRDSV